MDLEETLAKVELFSRETVELRKAEAERQALFLKCLDRLVEGVEGENKRIEEWARQVQRENETTEAAARNTRQRLFRGEESIKKMINQTLGAKIELLEELQQHADKSSHKVDMEVQLSEMRKRIEPWESI
jgi:hypothetical protein